jgi:hypothetical protein
MAGYKAPLTSRARRKKQSRNHGRAASARDLSESPPHPDLDYVVGVEDGRVVLEGTNDGNIRAAGGEPVRFRLDGSEGAGFRISATRLQKNRQQSARGPVPCWPFSTTEPSWPQREFRGTLKSPGLLGSALYKYSVDVEGAGIQPAVRVLIIDRR